MNKIYQGEDLELELTLTDENYNSIDISTLNNIIVYLYDATATRNKFSMIAMSGYNPIITGYDNINGRCKLLLPSTETKKLVEGDLYAEVMIKVPDTQFPDNDAKTVTSDLLIGTVVPAKTINE